MAVLRAMSFSNKASLLGYNIKGLLICLLMGVAGASRAQWFLPESVGARGGFSFGGSRTPEFSQAEGFIDWNLPWKTESEKGWFLQTKLNLSAGWMDANSIGAFEGTIGPAVALGHRHFPLSLEGGVGPAYISHYRFGGANFGENFQFTSYLGVNFDLTPHWRLGYRYQHMSNAGLAPSNPGLNLNMFALSYVF